MVAKSIEVFGVEGRRKLLADMMKVVDLGRMSELGDKHSVTWNGYGGFSTWSLVIAVLRYGTLVATFSLRETASPPQTQSGIYPR